MAYKRKYKKGSPIVNIQELADILEAGEYVFWYNKPISPRWVINMQLLMLLHCIRRRDVLYRAERIQQS
jgi:hypothetical protein